MFKHSKRQVLFANPLGRYTFQRAGNGHGGAELKEKAYQILRLARTRTSEHEHAVPAVGKSSTSHTLTFVKSALITFTTTGLDEDVTYGLNRKLTTGS